MVSARGRPDLAPGGFDDLRRIDPLARVDDGSCLDARHLENVLEQPRETLDLGHHEVGLFVALDIGQPRRVQIAGGHPDRRQRRAEVVCERGQQGRLELGAALGQFRLPALLEKVDALDRDGHHAAEGVERVGLDRPAGGRQNSERACPQPKRDQSDRMRRIAPHHLTSGRSLRIRFDGAIGLSQRATKFIRRQQMPQVEGTCLKSLETRSPPAGRSRRSRGETGWKCDVQGSRSLPSRAPSSAGYRD